MTRGLALVAATLLATLAAVTPSGAGEVRVITGPGISPPPMLEGTPRRVEAPARPVKPPAPDVDRRLGPVVVESAAELRAGRFRIRLAGVEAPGLDETCRDGEGRDWACGRRVLAAARRLVRLRPVTCRLPGDARGGVHETSCTLGGDDLAERFVAAGWARALAGGPYEAAQAEAEAQRRGIWGAAPVVTALPETPMPTGDALPPDLTTAPLTSPGATGAGTTGTAPRGTPPSAAPTVLGR